MSTNHIESNELNKLPAEVREAIKKAIKPYEGLLVNPVRDYAHALWTDILVVLAPLWPKPPQRIAEEVFDYVDAQGVMINRELHCGRIAAILAREFAAKDAEIAHERAATAALGRSFDGMRARAEHAEANCNSYHKKALEIADQRDQLRAEVERLTYRHAEAGWWSPATVKAYEKEVTDLRAQLAAARKEDHK